MNGLEVVALLLLAGALVTFLLLVGDRASDEWLELRRFERARDALRRVQEVER